ncbi:Protein of unknown function [Gryllus bimaculatus]|nr:Protein of unknown function [Gryllus bimaculatus]
MKSFTVLLISCSCVLLLLPNNEAIILDKLVNIIFPRGTKAPPVAGPTPINIVEPENSAIVDNATEAGEPVGTSAGPPAHSEAASTVQPTDYTTLPSTTESGNDTSKVLITAPASKCPAGQRRNHRGICGVSGRRAEGERRCSAGAQPVQLGRAARKRSPSPRCHHPPRRPYLDSK